MVSETSLPIRRILAPVDGSAFAEQALSFGCAVLGTDGELILFGVAPKAQPFFGLLGNVLLSAEQIQSASVKGVLQGLQHLREKWIRICRHIEIEATEGDPSDEILVAADRRQVDMIAMATHGRGGLDRWILGSVADRVSRASSIPVMLIHPGNETTPKTARRLITRLIVPLDGSVLASQAMSFASRIAIKLGIPVLLVTVAGLPREISIIDAYGTAFSQQIHDELLAEGRRAAEKTLGDAAASLRGIGVEVSHALLEGPVAKGIADITGENDVIVMTSHGHGGIRRFFLGSVANQVINHGKHAVILVPSSERNHRAVNDSILT